MLHCKPSRLTKKLRKEKLGARSYVRTSGHVCLNTEIKDSFSAQNFSQLQELFLKSLGEGRTEIAQVLSRHWRELFSNYCVERGQPLDASDWLSSLEDLERKDSLHKAKGKSAKRRAIMGYGVRKEKLKDGLFVENTDFFDGDALSEEEEKDLIGSLDWNEVDSDEMSGIENSGNFLPSLIHCIEKENLPFQYVDMWCPKYVQESPSDEFLSYAGSATRTDMQFQTKKELIDFGKYTNKFSMEGGRGLPGRVYDAGIPIWEQNLQCLSPKFAFARSAGAFIYGIKTALGIPVTCRSVEKMVVVLYSTSDISRDERIVRTCQDYISKHYPNPRWKLVVDAGFDGILDKKGQYDFQPLIKKPRTAKRITTKIIASSLTNMPDVKSSLDMNIMEDSDMLKILGQYMPLNDCSAVDLNGFLTIRLLLLRSASLRTEYQQEMLNILKSSYRSYKFIKRSDADTALLLAKDCTFLMQGMTKSMALQS